MLCSHSCFSEKQPVILLCVFRVRMSGFVLVCVRACERSWAVRIRSPRSTAQSRSRPLRSILLPAHLQFHPTPVKSLHARSNLKFLCIPNTCRFQPKPYAWDTLSAWRTWSGFVAWLLRKNPLHFYSVARLRCVWTAHLIRAYPAGSVAALIC